MNKYSVRWGLLLIVCALNAACHDRREPVKPTVAQPAAAVPAHP
jgi:hypothetical protein